MASWRFSAITDPQRDSIFIPWSRDPADVLDQATNEIAIGSKLGIAATARPAFQDGFSPAKVGHCRS